MFSVCGEWYEIPNETHSMDFTVLREASVSVILLILLLTPAIDQHNFIQ